MKLFWKCDECGLELIITGLFAIWIGLNAFYWVTRSYRTGIAIAFLDYYYESFSGDGDIPKMRCKYF